MVAPAERHAAQSAVFLLVFCPVCSVWLSTHMLYRKQERDRKTGGPGAPLSTATRSNAAAAGAPLAASFVAGGKGLQSLSSFHAAGLAAAPAVACSQPCIPPLPSRPPAVDPLLAPMQAGAWIGKPTPSSPRKVRFFQLSYDGSTLRWGWNK